MFTLTSVVGDTIDQARDQFSVFERFMNNNELIMSIVVVVVTFIFSRFLQKLVYNVVIFFSNEKNKSKANKLLKSYCNLIATVLRYLTYAIAFFVILSINHVPIITVLTSAGFIGIMITTSFSNLIQDITNGFFIVFEAPFEIGDRVKINEYVGKVVEITSRYVVLKDTAQNRYIINNRAIDSMVILSKSVKFE